MNYYRTWAELIDPVAIAMRDQEQQALATFYGMMRRDLSHIQRRRDALALGAPFAGIAAAGLR